MDLDPEWNYLFFKWMKFEFEYVNTWYNVGNLDYKALDDKTYNKWKATI